MTVSRESAEKMSVRYYDKKLPWRIKYLNHQFQLPEYFRELIGDKKSVKIADIGAGAISMIGTVWPGVSIEMVASDWLGDEYMKLWEKRGVEPLVRIHREDMEHLSYGDNTFDIVHCVNALDHTNNPHAAVLEMMRVCKPGGFVYLRHIKNEGENEEYSGFHQWNIEPAGDSLRIWGKNDEWIFPRAGGFKTTIKTEEQNTHYQMEESVVAIWQKPISQ